MVANFLGMPGISEPGITELIAVGGGSSSQLLLLIPDVLTEIFLLLLLLLVLIPLGKYLYRASTAARMHGGNHPAIPEKQYEYPQIPEQRLPEQRLPEQRLPEIHQAGKQKNHKTATPSSQSLDSKVKAQAVDVPGVDAPRVDTTGVDRQPLADPLVDMKDGRSILSGKTAGLEGYNAYSQLDSLEE